MQAAYPNLPVKMVRQRFIQRFQPRTFFAALKVDTQIGGDPENPGRKFCFPFKSFNLLISFHKNFLGYIFRFVPATKEIVGKVQDPILMHTHQLGKCLPIP